MVFRDIMNNMANNKLQSNIWKFYLISALSGFVLYYVIDKIFMEFRGLSITEIVLVEIVYVITVIVLEVPSGVLSDRWSRKNVLALNMVFFMLNTLLWALSHSLTLFILGVIAGAVHSALLSGTHTSFIYDTLKQLGRSGEYIKVLGNTYFYMGISAATAGILGGMISEYYGLAAPLWLTLIFSAMALVFILTLKEPEIHKTTGEIDYWKHIAVTLKYLRKHPALYHIVFVTVILESTYMVMDEYMQLYFVRVGIPVFFLGYLGAMSSGIESLGSKFSYFLERFNRRNVYLAVIILSGFGFLLAGYLGSYIGVIFVFLPIAAACFAWPLLSKDFHDELPSSQRATSESCVNLLNHLFVIPLAFLFGRLADSVSFFSAYLAIGIFIGFYLIVFLFVSYKKIGRKSIVKS